MAIGRQGLESGKMPKMDYDTFDRDRRTGTGWQYLIC